MAQPSPSKPRSRSLDQASLHESGVRLLRLRLSRRPQDAARANRLPEQLPAEPRSILKANTSALKNVARAFLRHPSRTSRSSSLERPAETPWVNQEALVNEVVSSPYRRRHSNTPSPLPYSPPQWRHNPQLLPCHKAALETSHAQKLAQDAHYAQKVCGETPSGYKVSVEPAHEALKGPSDPPCSHRLTPEPPPSKSSLEPTALHKSRITHSQCQNLTRVASVEQQEKAEGEESPTVLPEPKAYLMSGRVLHFYSSDEWRAALQSQERHGHALGPGPLPYCSGRFSPVPAWMDTEPDRAAPDLPGRSPDSPHRRVRSCSVGTECEGVAASVYHPRAVGIYDLPPGVFARPRAASQQYTSPPLMVSPAPVDRCAGWTPSRHGLWQRPESTGHRVLGTPGAKLIVNNYE